MWNNVYEVNFKAYLEWRCIAFVFAVQWLESNIVYPGVFYIILKNFRCACCCWLLKRFVGLNSISGWVLYNLWSIYERHLRAKPNWAEDWKLCVCFSIYVYVCLSLFVLHITCWIALVYVYLSLFICLSGHSERAFHSSIYSLGLGTKLVWRFCCLLLLNIEISSLCFRFHDFTNNIGIGILDVCFVEHCAFRFLYAQLETGALSKAFDIIQHWKVAVFLLWYLHL